MSGTLHPSDAPRPVSSRAEKLLWSRLKTGLPNGWTAWHSLRIRDSKNFLGETDFVLAHPERGLLVLEVKGGQIEQRGGHWFSNGIQLTDAPLDQGLRFLNRLIRRLDDWNCQPPAWGVAVAFPDADLDVQPAKDDLHGVVLGRNHLAWLGEWLPGVVEQALPAAGPARGEWMKRLHQLWGESWVPALSLGTRVDQARERRFALDELQLYALEMLAEQDHALIQGGAGTGKTLLAVEAARRQAAAGKTVLLLCFTQPLKKWLEARLAGTGVEVHTISGLAKQIAEAADGPWHASDLTDSETWRSYYERAMDLCRPRWDAVIIDEAQDLTYEAWFFVRSLSAGCRLWAFSDPGQGFWKDRTPPADLFGAPYLLRRGQRSPPGIEALASRYLGQVGDEVALRKAMTDRSIQLVACPDAGKTSERVGAEIDRFLAEGIALSDIGVVSLRGQTAADAVHHQSKLGRHAFARADDDGMEERLVADSFLRWKGLERPAIIVADVNPGAERFGTRMHIALTRALALVRVVAAADANNAWPGLSTT